MEFLILHYTSVSLAKTLEIFQNPKAKASAHLVIDPKGTVYELVSCLNGLCHKAWHAGGTASLIYSRNFIAESVYRKSPLSKQATQWPASLIYSRNFIAESVYRKSPLNKQATQGSATLAERGSSHTIGKPATHAVGPRSGGTAGSATLAYQPTSQKERSKKRVTAYNPRSGGTASLADKTTGATSSTAKGGFNNFSIGIELVNYNGNFYPYTKEQYEALQALLKELKTHYPALKDPNRVLGHEHIASHRGKVDPGHGFDWPLFFKMNYPEVKAPVRKPLLPRKLKEQFWKKAQKLKPHPSSDKNYMELNKEIEQACKGRSPP